MFQFIPLLLHFGIQPMNGQMGVDAGDYLLWLKRFGDIINCAKLQSAHLVSGFIKSGKKNHRNFSGVRICFQPSAYFKSVDSRHHDIQ